MLGAGGGLNLCTIRGKVLAKLKKERSMVKITYYKMYYKSYYKKYCNFRKREV